VFEAQDGKIQIVSFLILLEGDRILQCAERIIGALRLNIRLGEKIQKVESSGRGMELKTSIASVELWPASSANRQVIYLSVCWQHLDPIRKTELPVAVCHRAFF